MTWIYPLSVFNDIFKRDCCCQRDNDADGSASCRLPWKKLFYALEAVLKEKNEFECYHASFIIRCGVRVLVTDCARSAVLFTELSSAT